MRGEVWCRLIDVVRCSLNSKPTAMQKQILTNTLLMLGGTLCYEVDKLLTKAEMQ